MGRYEHYFTQFFEINHMPIKSGIFWHLFLSQLPTSLFTLNWVTFFIRCINYEEIRCHVVLTSATQQQEIQYNVCTYYESGAMPSHVQCRTYEITLYTHPLMFRLAVTRSLRAIGYLIQCKMRTKMGSPE